MTRERCPARRHGDYSAYCQGCRCPDAREDWRLYSKRRRQGRATPRLIPAVGTQRRIRALYALGWTGVHIAAAAGLHPSRPNQIMLRPTVTLTTAAAIRSAYDALSMMQGPSVKTRRHAQRQGWPVPLAWDDDEIDNPHAVPHVPDRGGWDLKPCGTLAAARRHYRRGEPLCGACRNAERRRRAA